MANYTVSLNDTDEEVMLWEANKRSLPVADLIKKVVSNFISEREGHYNRPEERLKRLSDNEKTQIPVGIRRKLGL